MERLKKLRKQHKLTQEQLGKYLGITGQSYSNYENDNREPDFATICRLADYFGVTVDYLLGRVTKNNQTAVTNKVIFASDGTVEEIELSDEDAVKLKKVMETFGIGKKKN